MKTTEYAIMYNMYNHDDIVCTTTSKKGAERLLGALVEHVCYNCRTSVSEVLSYRNETFFENGHRVWIEEVTKVTGLETFKKIIGYKAAL